MRTPCEIPVSPNLAGEWIGHYTGHFDEVVRIHQFGDHLEAVKVTGDDHVPAGEITWWANLRSRRGQGRIAEQEFRNPRFVPGRIVIVDEHHLIFHWAGVGSVEYRRDD
jgi:hypothetical protein